MVDVSSIAPDAMDKDESDGKEHIWRVLGYGNPGTGKTHFGFTMPEPIFCIDTENKAHSITDKFDKEIFLFEVNNYDEAKNALNQSLDALEAYWNEEDVRGTLMVDSMSNMWDWAQQKYMEMAYPGRDPHEVNFQSALQSGDSDWQSIKRLHNENFREEMVTSPFHLYWTCTSREDYAAMLSGSDDPPAKPDGEKNNVFKATEVVHFYEGEDGKPSANLKKNARTKWRFGGLEYPEFDKVEEIIESIVQAEKDPQPVTLSELKGTFSQDVSLFDGDPDVVMSGGEE
jgi:hypothetical protein